MKVEPRQPIPLRDALHNDLDQTNHDFMHDDHHHVMPTNIIQQPKEGDR